MHSIDDAATLNHSGKISISISISSIIVLSYFFFCFVLSTAIQWSVEKPSNQSYFQISRWHNQEKHIYFHFQEMLNSMNKTYLLYTNYKRDHTTMSSEKCRASELGTYMFVNERERKTDSKRIPWVMFAKSNKLHTIFPLTSSADRLICCIHRYLFRFPFFPNGKIHDIRIVRTMVLTKSIDYLLLKLYKRKNQVSCSKNFKE